MKAYWGIGVIGALCLAYYFGRNVRDESGGERRGTTITAADTGEGAARARLADKGDGAFGTAPENRSNLQRPQIRAEGERTRLAPTHEGGGAPSAAPTEAPSPDLADAWLASYRREFGEDRREVEGRVELNYPGYSGNFKVQFLLPAAAYRGTPSVAIVMVDESNPALRVVGTGNLEASEDAGGPVRIGFVGNSVQPFFRPGPGPDADQFRRTNEDPKHISAVFFAVDPRRRRGDSEVRVRFQFETEGPTTKVGRLDYVVKSPIRPNS